MEEVEELWRAGGAGGLVAVGERMEASLQVEARGTRPLYWELHIYKSHLTSSVQCFNIIYLYLF